MSAGTVYRVLGEAGLHPHETPEALLGRQRREEAIRLYREGMPGAEIARRLGVSDPRVVEILRGFRPPPPPKRSQEFERRAFDLLPQVESLRRDPSEENIRLTELALQNLAEDAGAYVASLPEFPREEMEEERWRAGFVRHRALRALEDIEVYRGCQQAMREGQAAALPRLVAQGPSRPDRGGDPGRGPPAEGGAKAGAPVGRLSCGSRRRPAGEGRGAGVDSDGPPPVPPLPPRVPRLSPGHS